MSGEILHTTSSEPAPSRWQRAGQVARPLAIAAVLAGAFAWGHHTGWKLPSLARSMAIDASWCNEHNVPEAICIECQPELLPADASAEWCAAHGVATCPFEKTELAQLHGPVEIKPALLESAEQAMSVRPREANNRRCLTHQKRIQFASTAAVEKAGIDIDIAYERPVTERISASGELVYDATRVANVAARASGAIWQVYRQVGDRVRQGDLLALVDSAEVGQAKSELLQQIAAQRLAQDTIARLRPLAGDGSISTRQLREAETALEQVRVRVLSAEQALENFGLAVRAEEFAGKSVDQIAVALRFLGLPEEIADSLSTQTTSSNLLPVRAPLDGMVTERAVVAGEVVDTRSNLFSVCDTTRLWLMLNIRLEDAPFVQRGQRVLFAPGSGAAESAEGNIAWISSAIDHDTQTVAARVEIANDDERWRANQFGTARIVLREQPSAVVVPSEAVHWDGCCQIVFVRDKNYLKPDALKFFHVRKVRTGVSEQGYTEVLAGLLPGEVVASKNSVLLEAQLLKSNLGAGCCEAH